MEISQYLPRGVVRILGRGSKCFIGIVNETTILKYAVLPHERNCILVEHHLLEVIGSEPRIIGLKGLRADGILLEHAVNGDLQTYLSTNADTALLLRLKWCKQSAEALERTHKASVIHCDFQPRNLLLSQTFRCPTCRLSRHAEV